MAQRAGRGSSEGHGATRGGGGGEARPRGASVFFLRVVSGNSHAPCVSARCGAPSLAMRFPSPLFVSRRARCVVYVQWRVAKCCAVAFFFLSFFVSARACACERERAWRTDATEQR